MIPMVNLRAQYEGLKQDIDAAIQEVLLSGSFIEGEACRLFEQEFAAFCGVSSACGVASGSDALYLTVRALGIGAGDEVVTTPFTFVATAEAVSRNGARIVFADIEDSTLNLDPARVEAAITPRTKAILPVHLYGHPARMEPLVELAARHGLAVIEDAAQAHGARYRGRPAGGLGTVGCFSFYPTKNLSACGDGGMLISNDADLIERARRIARHGSLSKYEHAFEGLGSRLDNLQAAVLRVKLRQLERWNERRREIARTYFQAVSGLPGLLLPQETPGCHAVYHLFTIRHPNRDGLRAHLQRKEIASSIHYPRPLHLQPAYHHLRLAEGSLPVAERVAREVLSLPLYPELTDSEVERVALEVREFAERSDA